MTLRVILRNAVCQWLTSINPVLRSCFSLQYSFFLINWKQNEFVQSQYGTGTINWHSGAYLKRRVEAVPDGKEEGFHCMSRAGQRERSADTSFSLPASTSAAARMWDIKLYQQHLSHNVDYQRIIFIRLSDFSVFVVTATDNNLNYSGFVLPD